MAKINENCKNVVALSTCNKFIWLMTNEDEVVINTLATSIFWCMQVRTCTGI